MKERIPRAYNQADVLQNDLMRRWIKQRVDKDVEKDFQYEELSPIDLVRKGKLTVEEQRQFDKPLDTNTDYGEAYQPTNFPDIKDAG